MMNDSLYNPDSMSKEDIKTLFVARQPLLDELVSTIRNQPNGAGVQHLLIIAPRGMGKTTMLLMVQFAVEDNNDLSKNWQAVRFPEESYDITELADFWLKVLDYLDDESLKPKIEEIEKRFTNSEDLREAAWALVKDWSKKHKKRIVLLIDNFDMILDQIGSDTEQARLRDILMNDGTVMLIGCAPSYFHQIQDYGQPLYNFFKTFNLNDLKFPDIEELIRRRAEIDEIPNIEELLQKNRTRIKALEAFTGGNPRLVLMLYRIITSSDMTEVRDGLERLLDAVTPYYKDKTEKLPPQQRKIINEIAQYSLEKREGISPTEIAQRIRMTPNQVSAQLKRLAENGYVRALNIRGRSSFYVLSEPLYAIWAQMRFGRNARERRNWLVQILKAIYDSQEIQQEIQKVTEKYIKLQNDGLEQKARGTLEFLLCLLETDSTFLKNNFIWAVYGYLILEEMTSLSSELTPERIVELPKEYIEILRNRGFINSKNLSEIKSEMSKKLVKHIIDFTEELVKDIQNDNLEETSNKIDKTISQYESEKPLENENNEDYYFMKIILHSLKTVVLASLNDFEKALAECDKTIQIIKGEIVNKEFINELIGVAYFAKGLLFKELKNLKESISLFEEAIFLIENAESKRVFTKENKTIVLTFINLQKTFTYLSIGQIKEASEALLLCKGLMNYIDWNWISVASYNLLEASKSTNLNSIKSLIVFSGLEEDFFPIIKAIDYLETKDETLIEKLSPEVRIVVEETIKTLQMIEENKSESETSQKKKIKKDRASETSLALSK
jgi:tetratricopeptide (TPR) repeat protein/DNA-binding MarR family transcriptional regulator